MYRNKDRTLELASKHTGYPKEVLSPAYDALAAAKVWPVNDGMPAEMVNTTINKMVEIGMLKESRKTEGRAGGGSRAGQRRRGQAGTVDRRSQLEIVHIH